MPEHTLSDAPIVRGNVVIPREGAWTADLVLSTSEIDRFSVGQTVMLSLAGYMRRGAVVRVGAPYNQLRLRVVGGNGFLGAALEARDYRQQTLGQIFRDALRDAGELAGNTVALDAVVLPTWSRLGEPAAHAVARLRPRFPSGIELRIDADGTWGAAAPTWPTRAENAIFVAGLPSEDFAEIAPDQGDAEPGTSVDLGMNGGLRRVDRIEYIIEPERFRAKCWLIPEGGSVDRLRAAFQRSVTRATLEAREVDPGAFYPARVVASTQGRVDLFVDDDRIGQKSDVPLVGGVGQRLVLSPGTRVLLGWQGGDLDKPCVLFAWLGSGGLVDFTQEFSGIYSIGDAGLSDGVATKVDLGVLYTAITTAPVAAMDGGAAFKAGLLSSLGAAGWTGGSADGKQGSTKVRAIR